MPLFFKKHKSIIIEIKVNSICIALKHGTRLIHFKDNILKYITLHTESRQFNLNQGEITSNQHECVNELFPLTGDLLVDTLQTIYKLEHFRPFQKKVIQSVMNRKQTLTVMLTGSGKNHCASLCPQSSALDV